MSRNPLSIDSVRRCRKCLNLGVDHVPSDGNPQADIMFIGQSPGEREVKKRKPFVGACGDYINWILDSAQLMREEIYIANALKCRPPGNRAGLKSELANCFKLWLQGEIKAVNPVLVVLFGRDAHDTVLMGRKDYGHLLVTASKKRTYLTVYHPGYLIRQGRLEDATIIGERIRELADELL